MPPLIAPRPTGFRIIAMLRGMIVLVWPLLIAAAMQAQAPANDYFSSATQISGSTVSTTGTNVSATKEAGEPSHVLNPLLDLPDGKSVWWKWTAPVNGVVTVDTIGSSFDTLLGVFTGYSVGALSLVARDDESGGSHTSLLTFNAIAGFEYRIVVAGYDSGSGPQSGAIKLNLSVVESPSLNNDNFANRASISGTSIVSPASNTAATKESGEPNHAGYAGGKSLWWSWTATTSGPVTLDTSGSSFGSTVAVYTGTAVNALTAVPAASDGGPRYTSLLTFHATNGTTYQIAVDTYSGGSGNAVLSLKMPGNDNLSGAFPLVGTSDSATGSNVFATKELGEPDVLPDNTGGKSVWWYWTAPYNGPVTINTVGSVVDTIMAVYTGSSVGALTKIAANADVAPNPYSQVSFTATAGVTYWIAVDGSFTVFGPAAGAIALQLLQVPANDNFANRISLSGEHVSTEGFNNGATKETGEPNHAGYAGGKSVWWSWTAPRSGTTTISTSHYYSSYNGYGYETSEFDTVLGVYTGTAVNALSTVASHRDVNGYGNSSVTFNAVSGTTYQIAVDGYNAASGKVLLEVTMKPSNDDFANRILLTGSSPTATGSSYGATDEISEPSHSIYGNRSLWWTWTAPTTGTVQLDTSASDYSTIVAAYTGTTLSGLTQRAISSGSTGIASLNVTAGITYHIAVDSYYYDVGTVNLAMQYIPLVTSPPPVFVGVTAGLTAQFPISVSSGSGFTYQWQMASSEFGSYFDLTNDGVYSGVDTALLEISTYSTTQSLKWYRCKLSYPGGAIYSSAGKLTVFARLNTTAFDDGMQPQNQSVQAGVPANFTAMADAEPAATYQWQRKPNGSGTWSDLSVADPAYAGVDSTTLTVLSPSVVMSGDQFRCNAHQSVQTQLGVQDVLSNAVTLTVTKIPATFGLSATSFAYTGSAQGPTVNATPSNATFTTGGTLSATNVGNYTATATATGDYSGSNASLGWSISVANQSAPVITSAASYTFGGSYTATATSGFGALEWALGTASTAAGAAIHPSTGVVTATGVGTVKIKARFAGDTNHNASSYTGDFTVTVSPITTTFALSATSFTYTGSPQGPTVNATPSNATFTTGGTLSATNAGSYTATATANGNYSGSNASLAWTIAKANQAAPTISSAAAFTFGGSYTATATGSGFGALEWALGSGSTATGAAVNATTGAVTATSVGTVKIKVRFAGDANHNASPYTADFTVTVNPVATTFALSATSFTYTGSAQGPTVNATPNNATFTTGGTLSATNVGSYTATATANGNYSGSNSSLSWAIAKANQPAPVITSGSSITFGAGYTATTNTGFGTSEWALGTGSTAIGASVDPLTGVVSYLSAGIIRLKVRFYGDANHNPSNYTGDFTLTINPAPTNFVLSATTFTYTGSPQGPTVNPTPSNATFTTGGTLSATNVGSYTATATANGNYSGTNNSLTWTIAKANQGAPTISSAASFTFGGSYTATATGSGFGAQEWALGTGSTATGAAINASSGAVTATSIGTVKIKVRFAGDANHNASPYTADFTVTVNPIATTFALSSTSFIYTGSAQGPAVNATPSNATFTTGGTLSATNVGSYTGTATANGNYTGSNASLAWNITKADQAAPTINSPVSFTLGGSYSATATSGFGALEWALGTGSTASGAGINVSSGAVTATSVGTVKIKVRFAGDANHNASPYTADFTVTVDPIATTFALSATSFVYTGSAQGPTVNATPSNATFSTGGTLSATNVGSYTGTATANGNYTGTNNSLAWNITKANQGAPTISSAASFTFGGSYTATATGSGFGAQEWALGSGSTATGAAVNATSGAVTATSVGTVKIKVRFAGDANHNASPYTSDFTVTVNPIATTFALSATSFTYTGSSQGPTVNATPGVATFTPGGTLSATNAGSYTATATANGNYTGTNNSLVWSIAKASATVTLGSLNAVFDGQPHAASATTVPSGRTVDFTYDGSPVIPIMPGSYAVVGTINDQNYTGTASGTLVIVDNGPVITAQSEVRNVVAPGQALVLSVNAVGTGTVTYQWTHNGRPFNAGVVSTANGSTFTAGSAMLQHSGWYQVTVTNATGTVRSAPFFVSVAATSTHVWSWGLDLNGRATAPNGLIDAIAVAAGDQHALALRRDGTVVAWGDNTFGQTNVPVGLAGVVSIAAGYTHSLALKADGTVVTWGQDLSGVVSSIPADLDGVVGIAAGSAYSLALKADGTLVGWGNYNYGQMVTPVGLADVVGVAAGWYHVVALKADGTVVAWGENGDGQAVVPGSLAGVEAVAATSVQSSALKSVGTVIAWGTSGPNYDVPVGLSGVVAIAGGKGHTLALKSDGTVVGWGSNFFGDPTPPGALADAFAISAGSDYSLALTNKKIPVITWAAPAAITYGAALSSTQLNATADVAGTFAYLPASGAVLNAGTQVLQVTFTPTDSIKYAIVVGTTNLTVNPVATTFALSATSFTYTGSAQGPTVNATPGVATFTTGGTLSATNAGSYTATATANGNYTGTNNSLTWTIAKANQTAPTISSAASFTFGGSYTATATGSGFGALEWALGTGSTASGAAINASSGAVTATSVGTVKIKVRFAGDANHNTSPYTSDFTVTVNPIATTFALSATSFTYTGSAQGPTVNATPGIATFATGGTLSAINAGSYTATATANGNYSGTNNSLTWTIAKANQGAPTISSAATFTFGGSYTATATGSGLGVLEWALGTGSTASGAAVNASSGAVTATSIGTVKIKVRFAGDANHNASPYTSDFTVTVNPIATTFALSATSFTYTGSPQGPAVNVTPSNATFTTGGTLSATNVGSYTGTATANGNYTGTNNSLTWNIAKANQAAPTISSASAFTFGGNYTATAGGSGFGALEWALGTGSTATGAAINASSGAVTATSVGTVKIKVRFAGDANHNASPYTADFTVTVNPIATTFALSTTSFTYTGSAQGPTVNATPSNATFTTGGVLSATNAGSYTATATANGNYTGSNGALGWFILKAAAPVVLGNLSATYDGTPKAVTATTTPGGLAVTITYDGSATPPTAPGSYAVVATVNDANYNGTVNATLVISGDLNAQVGKLFQRVYGRAGTLGEVQPYVTTLGSGGTLAGIFAEMLATPEYLAREKERAIRLYYATFSRMPDQGGLYYWAAVLGGGSMTPTQVATAFAQSQEFLDTYGNLGNEAYITQLYRNTLGRDPDAGGLAYWVGQMNAGLTRGQMLLAFADSQEFADRMAPEIEVVRLYHLLFDRMPTTQEYLNWRGFVRGYDQTETILSSTEFNTLHPSGLTNAQYVQAVFQGFLLRAADQATQDSYTALLGNSSLSRAELIHQIMDSGEFRTTVVPVTRHYLAVFLRAPDLVGSTHWTNQMRAGLGFTQLSQVFADSAEFASSYAGLTDTQFVSQMYLNILGRPADTGGLNHWVNLFATGQSDEAGLLLSFVLSWEAGWRFAPDIRTIGHYQAFYGRSPTNTELTFWKDYLTSLPAQFRQELLDSEEFNDSQ